MGAILAVNLVVSLAGFRAFRQEHAQASGVASGIDGFLFIPHQVARGENLKGMLLAHFAHGNFLHLGFNMLALLSFASGVLGPLGTSSFLLIYVIAGLGSDMVVYALRKNDPQYRCLGASGSVTGVVAAAVVVDPTISVVFLFVPIPIPGPVFLLGYVLISLYLISRNQRGGISHEGHLGGSVAGFIVTGVLSRDGFGPLLDWFGALARGF